MSSTPSIPSSRGSARPHLCHCQVLRGVASFLELQVRDEATCAGREGFSLDRVHHLPFGY